MALIIIPCAATKEAVEAGWASIPYDVIASGNNYWLQPDKGVIFTGSKMVLGGKLCGPNNGIRFGALPANTYVADPTNRYAYVEANGLAIRGTGEGTIEFDQDWLTVDPLQVTCNYEYSHKVVSITAGCPNSVFKNLIIDGAPTNQFSNGLSVKSGKVLNPLVILRSGEGTGVNLAGNSTLIENPTVVRPSNVSDAGRPAFSYDSDGATIRNANVFGFSQFMINDSPYFNGENNATDLPSMPFGTGKMVNVPYADQFVNTVNGTHDFRLKVGSVLIDSGATPSAENTTTHGGNRQQGTSADRGAYEFPQAVQAPTLNITAIDVAGTTVTISGTFTGGVTEGKLAITPSAVFGNNAVAQGPKAITVGAGVWSVQFTACKVGVYGIVGDGSNPNYLNVPMQNDTGGGFQIESAKAVSVIQDPMAGQILTIHGKVSGAVSGNLVVPPDPDNPAGATQQSAAVTITGAVDPKDYTVSVPLVPGAYDAGILTFTNADGTSLPQPGTMPVVIIPFVGNPEAPPIDAPPGGGGGATIPATILVNGVMVPIKPGQVGTGKKPLVYVNGRIRQRVASEGVPIVRVNGRYRLLAQGETLGI